MKQYIKSGANNYGRGYDGNEDFPFPTLTFESEVHFYDEETGAETDELDYDAINEDYEMALEEANNILNKYEVGPDYSGRTFWVSIESGYYDGMQTVVHDGYNDGESGMDKLIYQHDSYENIKKAFEEMKEYGWQ